MRWEVQKPGAYRWSWRTPELQMSVSWARERSRDERSKEEGQVPQTLETALVAVMVEELLKKNKDLQEQAARWMEEKKKEVSHLGQKWWNRQHQRGDQEER